MSKVNITEAQVLDVLHQIEKGKIQLTPDCDPQDKIKGDILFHADNGWAIEVSNWSGDFSGIVEITTADGTILDADYLEKHMPLVDQYFPEVDAAWRAYRMKLVVCGFVYLSNDKKGRFDGANAGDVVSNPDTAPPWIIVEPQLKDVLVARWPGKLWLVQVLEKLEPQDHRGSYIRCISVKLILEMKTSNLFGSNGEAVEDVFAYASALNEEQAKHLAVTRHANAKELQSKGWHRWQSLLRAKPIDTSRDMSGVVRASDNVHSPVGYGLSLAHSTVWDAAKREAGDAAFDEDEDECWLIDPWSGAAGSLMDAVWALGCPELFDDEERRTLLRAWSERICN